jgi:hypothetical protein
MNYKSKKTNHGQQSQKRLAGAVRVVGNDPKEVEKYLKGKNE